MFYESRVKGGRFSLNINDSLKFPLRVIEISCCLHPVCT